MCYPTLTSELSFCGLFLFAKKYQYEITNLGQSLCIIGTENSELQINSSIDQVGHIAPAAHAEKNKIENADLQPEQNRFLIIPGELPEISALRPLFSENYCIKVLPLHLRNAMQKSLLELEATLVEKRGDFDYLYRRSDLAELKGTKFHKKRNHVNYFIDHYTYQTLTITKDTLCDVFHVLNIWRQQHQSDIDLESVKTAILHFEQLPLFGQITYVNNVPAAFVMAEYIYNQKAVVVHQEKADIQYKGIYQYINKNFAQSLPLTCRLINREQDLGDPGLRKAKESYKPVQLLKKFRVFPNTA